MTRPIKVSLLLGVGSILFICCLLPVSCSSYNLLSQIVNPINPDIDNMTVTAGSLEVIVPSAHDPDVAFVSPTGHWLVYLNIKTEQWFIIDLQTNQERLIDFNFLNDVRWLNNEEFAAGYRIIKAIDLSVIELDVSGTPENDIVTLEVLRGAKQVYLLPTRGTSGVDVMSGDPDYPYGFDAFGITDIGQLPEGMTEAEYTYIVLQERFPETAFVVVKSQYFQPTPGYRGPHPERPSARYYVNFDLPSLDGRFYAKTSNEKGLGTGTGIDIYQCGEKLVAHAAKKGWHMYPKGWAYDNSGFYFFLQPKGGWFGTGGSSVSVLKLNLPPDVLANAPPYEGEGFCE